jgi:hypothetical protein
MPSLTGKRSRIITIAVAGTLSLAGIVSTAAITLPNASPAASRSSAATSSFVVAASPAFAQTDVITGGQGAARRVSTQQATSLDDVRLAASIRQYGYRREVAAKSAARAAAEKAAAAKVTAAKAAAAKAAVPTGSPQQIAEQMLGQFGWSGSQFSCLDPLWAHESGWSVTASNPSTDAYGIAQALPGNRMASAGPDWQTNAATQIKWGLEYIQSTYGSPCAAWSHEESDGWY